MTRDEPRRVPEGPLSPDDVAGREFAPARRGYDRAEVRAFLESVASTIAAASERIVELERRLARVAATSGDAPAEIEDGLLEAVSAELWRDDVLADLDRRRRELNAEVVRLRAGRDRLRADLDEVVSDISEQLRRLDGSLQAARAAGDLEEQRIRSGPPLTVEERRAELEAARLAGFVTAESAPESATESTAESAAVSATVSTAEPAPVDGASRRSPGIAGTGDPPDEGLAKRPARAQEPGPGQGAGFEVPSTDAPDALGAEEVGDLFARLRAERTEDPRSDHQVDH